MKGEISAEKSLNLKIWSRLLPYIRRMRRHVVVVLASMFLSSLLAASYPLFTSYAVNHFVVPGTTVGVPVFAAFFGLVIVIEGLAVVINVRHSMIVEMETGKMLKRDCFTHLQVLPLSYYNQNSVGYILARVMSDTDRISGVIAWGFMHLAWNLADIICMFAFMLILNARLALLLLAILPVVVVVTWFFEKKILVVNRKIRAVNALIVGAYNEGITGAKTSKTLAVEEDNTREFRQLTANMYGASICSSYYSALLLPIIFFFGSLAVAIVLYRGGYLVMNSLLDYGVLAAFISYAVGMVDPVSNITGVITEIISAQANIERITSLLNEECTISDTPEVTEKYGDAFRPKRENWEEVRGEIEFRDVWFRYPDGEEYVLENFNLSIPAGTNVAIVGETGAGKSTIVNLACRFFEPTAGQVLIDGVDYRKRSQLWLHSSLGYVLQSPHLFSGTIRDNIRFGRPDASEEEVERAAELVSADKIIKKLPQGYDTEVGEGGDRLSTGEKQLISLARAMIADPPIFVLDEATSSIDTETEQLIQNAISHVLKGRTSFIIAHRLSTIRQADLILVVRDGRIIEQGTHRRLMDLGGHYMRLYSTLRLSEAQEG